MAELTQADRDKLTTDYNRAVKYLSKHLAQTKAAIDARMKYLTLAMTEFNAFLGLKPAEKTGFWDVAFAVLDLVPGVRLAKFLTKQTQAATLALEIAKATGNKYRAAAVVKTVAGAGGKVVKAVNTAKDVKDKLKDPVGNIATVGGAVKERVAPEEEDAGDLMSKYDTQRKAIQALVEDEKLAIKLWDQSYDAVIAENDVRLTGHTSPGSPATLEEHAVNLLGPVQALSAGELQEVELLYLWEMIWAWARKEAKIRVITTVHVRNHALGTDVRTGGTTTSLSGFNSEQEAEIYRLFGFAARRGKIFYKPPVWNQPGVDVLYFAGQNQVNTVRETKYQVSTSVSAKM